MVGGFIVTAICVVSGRYERLSANWLGIMFLLWVIALHAPRVVTHHTMEMNGRGYSWR
jgi:hypothetical protein